MNFNPSLNYGTLKAQDLQKLKDREKETEKAAQQENKGNAPQVDVPKGEPVKASALDVMAQQNMGLGIVNKKTPIAEGAAVPKVTDTMTTGSVTTPSSVEGEKYRGYDYEQLVAQWNHGNNNLSFEEQFWLLENLWIKAPTNEDKGHWAVMQQQVKTIVSRQALEAAIEGFENGTLDPAAAYEGTTFGNELLMGPLPFGLGCQHCYYVSKSPEAREGISHSTQIQMLEERIEYCELMIDRAEAAMIYNPIDCTHNAEDSIKNLQKQIAMCRARISEIEGYIPKDEVATAQINNNEPAVQ